MRTPLLVFSLLAATALWACTSASPRHERNVTLAEVSIRIDGFVQTAGIT